MKNKRGAELTIGTIVIIVLAIAVLVFLIFGFTTGWSNLWAKIGIFGGGGANIAEIRIACAASCAKMDSYSFNDKKWNVRDEDGYTNSTATCRQLIGTVNLEKGGATKPIIGAVESCPAL